MEKVIRHVTETIIYHTFHNVPYELWRSFRQYVYQQELEQDSPTLEFHTLDCCDTELILDTESVTPLTIWASCEHWGIDKYQVTKFTVRDEVLNYMRDRSGNGLLDWPTKRPPEWTLEAKVMELIELIEKEL